MSNFKPAARILAILGILILPSVAYLLISRGTNKYTHLEIFGPRDPVPGSPGDTVYHEIGNFSLTDQNGETFTRDSLKDKIYIADFFFATCQTICPKMNMQMKRIQDAYKDDPEIALLSYTVNPEKDTVEALKAYSEEMGAIDSKWHFLTGSKTDIYDLARTGYFLTASEGDGGPDDFIHSNQLILVDKDFRIRGYYDGTEYTDVDKLIDEIKVLKWEYEQEPVK